MSKSAGNAGKLWTKAEVQKLRDLAKKKTPAKEIGKRLKRSLEGVRKKARQLRVRLAVAAIPASKPKKKRR